MPPFVPFHHLMYLDYHIIGTVKWFNVRDGYGFITREDTKEDVFVHKFGIARNNPNKIKPSLGDGEKVQFDIVCVPWRTPEAVHVSGVGGTTVEGSPHAPNRHQPPPHENPSSQAHISSKFPEPSSHAEEVKPTPSQESTTQTARFWFETETTNSNTNVPTSTGSDDDETSQSEEDIPPLSHEYDDEDEAIPCPSLDATLQLLQESAMCFGDCCHHLQDWITALLVLCQLEDVSSRVPSEQMLKVLLGLCQQLRDLGTHCLIYAPLRRIKNTFWRYHSYRLLNRHDHTRDPRPAYRSLNTWERTLYLEEDIANATNITADQIVHDSQCTNSEEYGKLLLRICNLFCASIEQDTIVTTLYNCYRRWRVFCKHERGFV